MIKLIIIGTIGLSISCQSKISKEEILDHKPKIEYTTNTDKLKAIINLELKQKKDSLEVITGVWKVKNKFLRQISAVNNDELELLSNDSIIVKSDKIIFLKNNICNFTGISIDDTDLDSEIKEKFKLLKTAHKNLVIKCGNYDEYLTFVGTTQLIYEIDGAVFLLEKIGNVSN